MSRLVWAGNGGTPSVSGYLNAYSASYAYTHLGQLWQGPRSGSGEYQYLYCSSSQPHQLSGLYASGATCSSKTGQVYATSDDSWGNVTSRTYSGPTGTLSYDLLDHFTKWFVNSSNTEFYAYDAAGNRVLRRATNGSGTTMTVYAFGLEEHQYSGSGSNQWNVYYYSLGGRLLGSLDGNGTQFYLSDALGSVVSAFTNAAGGASLKGNQLFGPYGSERYGTTGAASTRPKASLGSTTTARGWTTCTRAIMIRWWGCSSRRIQAALVFERPDHIDQSGGALPNWSADRQAHHRIGNRKKPGRANLI